MNAQTFRQLLEQFGTDILQSSGMQLEREFIQHGNVSVLEHSIHVAYLSLWLAYALRLEINTRALLRGALLHDYFLYDWHIPDPSHRLHGFRHAKFALKNAMRDFSLGKTECDIIARHMFPLNLTPPKYRESILVCLADKICAVCETMSSEWAKRRFQSRLILTLIARQDPALRMILTANSHAANF
ncbi:MAG: HD domain-containing protein [Candidatus Merdivicinus sp.]